MEETKDYIPLPDDRFLAPTDIDLAAMADAIEQGLMEAAIENMPRMSPPSPSVTASRCITNVHWTLATIAGCAMSVIGSAWSMRSSPREEIHTVEAQPQRMMGIECPEEQRNVTVTLHRKNPVGVEVCIGETKHVFLLHDAIPFVCSDGVTRCFVGKYTTNHEWILLYTPMGNGVDGVFFCSEEGIYTLLKRESGRIVTRQELLHSPAVQAYLSAFPPLVRGGKTPQSWGRDTSYGGKRGVERMNRIIANLKSEADQQR
jgi:hypothetical protein